MTQWSRGQYLNATNTEDDLTIITTQNGFGYRTDDYGNGLSTAAPLSGLGARVVTTGLISTSSDRDFFFFETAGGRRDGSTVLSRTDWSNLDLYVRLYNSNGTVIGTTNPVDQLNARIARTLAAGRYFITWMVSVRGIH